MIRSSRSTAGFLLRLPFGKGNGGGSAYSATSKLREPCASLRPPTGQEIRASKRQLDKANLLQNN